MDYIRRHRHDWRAAMRAADDEAPGLYGADLQMQVEAERMIEALDTDVFNAIQSQTSKNDRTSLLSIQKVLRQKGSYVYLEIGSFRGGTLQPHVVDRRCNKIFSVDLRPEATPDTRGNDYDYEGVTTADMLNSVRRIGGGEASKVICFDQRSGDVDKTKIHLRPDFCFIDGVI